MKTTTSITTFTCQLLVAVIITASPVGAQAESRFQTSALFNPGKGLLLAEADDRVMIYDGLKSETVDQALDEQFDRIQNMMFVRTKIAQEDGSYEVENDCD